MGTLVLLFVVDKIMGLRVTPEQEAAGLDLSQHGEEGYDFNASLFQSSANSIQRPTSMMPRLSVLTRACSEAEKTFAAER